MGGAVYSTGALVANSHPVECGTSGVKQARKARERETLFASPLVSCLREEERNGQEEHEEDEMRHIHTHTHTHTHIHKHTPSLSHTHGVAMDSEATNI